MENILSILKNYNFKNALIYNVKSFTNDDLITISENVNNLFCLYDNNFLISSLRVKMRRNKNIFIDTLNRISINNYDIIISDSIPENLIEYLINNSLVRIFMFLGNYEIKKIPGFEKINQKIFKRNESKILIDANSLSNIFEKNKEKLKNINDIIFNEDKNNKDKIKQNENIKKSKYFEIIIKNIVPTIFEYSKVEHRKNINGIIDLKFIINDKKDFEFFIKYIDEIFEIYSNIKIFVILNGKDTFKFETELKNVNNLIKFEEEEKQEKIKKILSELMNDEYTFDMNNENINDLKYILGLL